MYRFQPRLQGAWLLSDDWLRACETKGQWVDEEPFLVKVRVIRKHRDTGPLLLSAPSCRCRQVQLLQLLQSTIAFALLGEPSFGCFQGDTHAWNTAVKCRLPRRSRVSHFPQQGSGDPERSGTPPPGSGLPVGRTLFDGLSFFLDQETGEPFWLISWAPVGSRSMTNDRMHEYRRCACGIHLLTCNNHATVAPCNI